MPDLLLELPTKTIDGYLALPPGTGPFPAVVVLHEAFGLNADIRLIADRLAVAGYVAMAPDLLEGGRLACMAQAMKALQAGRGVLADVAEEVVDWLSARSDVAAGRIGAIGFCMGGGFAYLLGLTGKLSAVAPNYGQPPKDLDRLEASCPVVASYGGKDKVYRKHAARVEAALDLVGIPNDVKLYPEAGHSFMNDSDGHTLIKVLGRPIIAVGYHPEAAEDAWTRIHSFFTTHLGPDAAATGPGRPGRP
ncbi:MAG: dienelactone hydrolase family protein [Acidimicrobiia bacterium]